MHGKLKIYACSGIGDAEEKKALRYWTDDTNTLSNTQAVNTLLVRINSLYITANRLQGISNEEKLSLLNDINVLSVCLEAAKRFAGNKEALHHAGQVIAQMVARGECNYDSLNSEKREDFLEDLIEKANEAFNDETPITDAGAEFMSWWQKTVMERDLVGLNFGQQQNARKALKKGIEAIKGIGVVDWNKYNDGKWLENADLAELLTAGADYFLYTYFTDAQLAKLPAVFKLKKKKQLQTYNYCKQLFVDVYGSEEDMQRIIKAGIIDSLEQTPEDYCAGITEQGMKAKPVGELVLFGLTGAAAVNALIELLTVVTTLIVGIITAVCSMVAQTNVAKYGALDRQVVDSSVPDASDYDGLNFGGSNGTSGMSWLPMAAIGLGLILLLKK